ncbi:MAG: hypothetical protein ACR2NR_13435 [Solirubrobacteraceae bacterium]
MTQSDAGEPAPLRPASGFVAAEVAAEFPGLRLDWVTLSARRRPSPPSLVAQLQRLAGRVRGASVIAMRTQPIPHAYRAFFRQIGLDPDVDRIPSERAALQRLLDGGFRSVDLIADACLLALLETGVPVWALDADAIDEHGLGIRMATADAVEGVGYLAVADGSSVHARLFADPGQRAAIGSRTRRVALFAVAVAGVPSIHVEEALWQGVELVGNDPREC